MLKKKFFQKKIKQVLSLLTRQYPDAGVALNYADPFQLLIATILSAQCTDKQVNRVTPSLFEKYPTPQAMQNAVLKDIERVIHSTGFFHNKAKNIRACARGLVEQFGGKVPKTMKELTSLSGVGRKTANVVLPNAFGKNEGICVDTHVARLSQRIGFSKFRDPIRVERDLMKIVPKKHWSIITDVLIRHGRKICNARKPLCDQCVVREVCDYYQSLKIC